MGLHRSHPAWRSLVVRTRDTDLPARLLTVLLEGELPSRAFVDAVPADCRVSFSDIMANLSTALHARGAAIAALPAIEDFGDVADPASSAKDSDSAVETSDDELVDFVAAAEEHENADDDNA